MRKLARIGENEYTLMPSEKELNGLAGCTVLCIIIPLVIVTLIVGILIGAGL